MANVEVILDIREVTNYPELTELASNNKYVESYSVEMLEIGDFIVDKNVIVEHKSIGDFIESMKSGHLEDQLERMYMGYDYVYILISGNMEDFDGLYWSGTPDKAVKGFIASLSMRWDVTPLFCSNISNVFYETVTLGRKAKEPMERTPTGPSVSLKDDMSSVEEALMLIDGISTTLAERVDPHFDTIGEICRSEADDLTKIDGIGPQTAQNIKEKLK